MYIYICTSIDDIPKKERQLVKKTNRHDWVERTSTECKKGIQGLLKDFWQNDHVSVIVTVSQEAYDELPGRFTQLAKTVRKEDGEFFASYPKKHCLLITGSGLHDLMFRHVGSAA